ncbi:MAG TPA: NAD(P)-dependent oxidoreductase [Stellaceae bacterium]|jgi:nucleoside-diphosphate-sugar epimerase|nr:NAD(P)-dependent oxidoreductase [Stellaceae bacterium]
MSKKRVLVCGATGFIGRNITEALSLRTDVEVVAVFNRKATFDCPNVEWVHADLTNPQDVTRALQGIDVVVQAAATTSGAKDIVARPYIHVTDNAVMNSLLFRACYDAKIGHLIFFSCTVMYQSSGSALEELDFDAGCELYPQYFGVGWTKVYLEKMCEFYSRLGATKFTAIRHSNIYGPHDKFDLERSHVFGATVTKVMTAKDGKIVVWGSGEESRDLLYVDDLVKMVECAIERQSDRFALYNCGYGEAVSIRELVAKIIARSGRELKIEHDLSQPSIKTSLFLDCGKALRELGWRRAVSLDDGIARTLDWWRQNFDPGSGAARSR